MKKIINDSSNYVKEMMEGIYLAHSDKVTLLEGDYRILVRKNKSDKVAIVTAGGSGHLPLFLGYVGEGMLDGCAVGDVFASPSSDKMLKMIEHCDSGKGVICLYGNYGGDKMNFAMACELAEFNDIKTVEILGKDDIASADEDNKDIRRGVAGIVYAYKIAGAASELGKDMSDICRVVTKALKNTRTMGVAISPCIIPKVGKPTFDIEEGKIEIGMGIHGEQGIEVVDMLTADEIAILIINKIEKEIKLSKGDMVSIMINGLGATPLDEQYIVYRRVHKILEEKGVHIIMPHIGEFATSMEMSGLSVTLIKLDEELVEFLKYPANTPFYTNYNR